MAPRRTATPAHDRAICDIRTRICYMEASATHYAAARCPEEEQDARNLLVLLYQDLDALLASRTGVLLER